MKVLVDTSVWFEHWRRPIAELGQLAEGQSLLIHPFVLGEVALGQVRNRAAVLKELRDLEPAARADDSEVFGMIERHRLSGSGVGWVDCHLMASARLSGARLMTRDLALKAAWLKVGAK